MKKDDIEKRLHDLEVREQVQQIVMGKCASLWGFILLTFSTLGAWIHAHWIAVRAALSALWDNL